MITTVRWNCPNCCQSGSLSVTFPIPMIHLEEQIHGAHRDRMSARHCACTHYSVQIDLDALPEVPELKDTKPIVLYFANDADRAEFEALMKAAKPGMITRSL